MPYLLGIDVSTTATKALLVDEGGAVAAVCSTPHALPAAPNPLWSEQDPEDWWSATCTSVRRVVENIDDPSSIVGVGLTGQMHGLVMLDADHTVLRPAILWNDQRASAECDEIRDLIGLESLVAIAGNDAFAGFTAPKLLWVRRNEPDVYARMTSVLLPKDYIRLRLTNVLATDKAGAGGTLFLDLNTRDWSDQLLEKLYVPRTCLPPTYEGPEITGRINSQGAAETGLSANTPVVAGGGDQAAQAVGVGAVTPEIMALTVGTSGVVFASTNQPVIEPNGRVHSFPHAVPDRWHVMGVMLSAAGSLQWYHDALAFDIPYDNLVAEATEIEPGSEGLVFLPYLSGERTPHANSRARGAFVGLTTKHTRAHMTRAVLEGVAFGLRDNFQLLNKLGLERPTEVRLSGGGAKSTLLRQLLADVIGTELVSVEVIEGAALGAAILAGVGAGVWESVDVACELAVQCGKRTTPDDRRHDEYGAHYQRFRDLYPLLKDFFEQDTAQDA